MSKVSYEQAYSDHSYLWTEYGAAKDMTGAYVDQDDLDKLLRSPTKATARDCLVSQIHYWFEAGPDTTGGGKPADHSDARLREIADRYSVDLP